jgi:hypothetical protein
MPRGVYERKSKADPVTPAANRTKRPRCCFQMEVILPEDGLVLKVRKPGTFRDMIGTVTVTREGLTFAVPNAKRKPERVLTWSMLKVLHQVEGFL